MRANTDYFQHCSAPRYRRRKLRLDGLDVIQELDPVQPVDDVGVALWRFCLPWPHVLEAQVVSDQLTVSWWVHCYGSLFHLRHRIIHRLEDCG